MRILFTVAVLLAFTVTADAHPRRSHSFSYHFDGFSVTIPLYDRSWRDRRAHEEYRRDRRRVHRRPGHGRRYHYHTHCWGDVMHSHQRGYHTPYC